jgi:hypothetical protein
MLLTDFAVLLSDSLEFFSLMVLSWNKQGNYCENSWARCRENYLRKTAYNAWFDVWNLDHKA